MPAESQTEGENAKPGEPTTGGGWRSPTHRQSGDGPGRTGSLMGRGGATVSQAKEVSPTGGWIGIRISSTRDGLRKGPLNETRRLCREGWTVR